MLLYKSVSGPVNASRAESAKRAGEKRQDQKEGKIPHRCKRAQKENGADYLSYIMGGSTAEGNSVNAQRTSAEKGHNNKSQETSAQRKEQRGDAAGKECTQSAAHQQNEKRCGKRQGVKRVECYDVGKSQFHAGNGER